MASTTLSSIAGARRSRFAWLRHSGNWLYLIPAMVFFVGYLVYPIVQVFWISFTDYKYLINVPTNFTGLKNYVDALNDPVVITGLQRAAVFTAVFLPGMIFLPMLLAILIDRVRNQRIATVYRLILLLPAVIPGPMIFLLWKWMYDFEIGPINYILINYLHLFTYRTAPQWIGNSWYAIPAIAAFEIW